MDKIRDILVDRDGITWDEADELVEEAKYDLLDRLDDGELPFDICEEYFGLEPDYLDELMSELGLNIW